VDENDLLEIKFNICGPHILNPISRLDEKPKPNYCFETRLSTLNFSSFEE
jgi:hypothetical protein